MKKILFVLLIALLILVGILLFNTLRFESKQQSFDPISLAMPDDVVVDHLAQAIRFKTISFEDTTRKLTENFIAFHQFLAKTYPLCDSLLEKKMIKGLSLLYKWEGKNPQADPVLLMAHQDVVPIEDLNRWKQPPFEGRIVDGHLWGRGSLDDKNSLLGIMEGVEWLLREGYQPSKTVYLAFGHDEEVAGTGAAGIVEYLQKQGVKLEMALDEGMIIADGMIPGISRPTALIGISEKGFANIELSVAGVGGHSSMPPPETAIGILSNALVKVENNPMPAHITDGPAWDMFDYIAPEMDFGMKLVFANHWLFKPIIGSQLSGSNTTNASIRTTTAPTMLSGSIKANVLPSEAKAVINFRILPGETVDDILAHLTEVIGDERVKLSVRGHANNPPPVSSTESAAFQTLHQTIKQIYPEIYCAPALTIATTDSRFYTPIAKDVYRFLPAILNSEDIKGIHGANEHIDIQDYKRSIQFYYLLVKNLTK